MHFFLEALDVTPYYLFQLLWAATFLDSWPLSIFKARMTSRVSLTLHHSNAFLSVFPIYKNSCDYVGSPTWSKIISSCPGHLISSNSFYHITYLKTPGNRRCPSFCGEELGRGILLPTHWWANRQWDGSIKCKTTRFPVCWNCPGISLSSWEWQYPLSLSKASGLIDKLYDCSSPRLLEQETQAFHFSIEEVKAYREEGICLVS